MGLDQFIYKNTRTEAHYWRKFGELQNLMTEIYHERTGNDDEFNCVDLPLDVEIIDEVIHKLQDKNMPEHHGFFFGGSNMEDEEYIKEAIEVFRKIKTDIGENDAKYVYSAWY